VFGLTDLRLPGNLKCLLLRPSLVDGLSLAVLSRDNKSGSEIDIVGGTLSTDAERFLTTPSSIALEDF